MIFLTGRDDSETTLRAFAAGGADFVLKPFAAELLSPAGLFRATHGVSWGLRSGGEQGELSGVS